jgi:hypothetical protein
MSKKTLESPNGFANVDFASQIISEARASEERPEVKYVPRANSGAMLQASFDTLTKKRRQHDADKLRNYARQYTMLAIETLVDICKGTINPSARVAAANALLDRGYGKVAVDQVKEAGPATRIKVSFDDGAPGAQVITTETDELDDGEDA